MGYGVGVVLPLVGLLLVGGRLRRLLPEGYDLAQFVRLRFGPGMQGYVLLISMLYMFTALAAELTAVSSVLGRISDLDPRIGIIAVAAVTAAYTAGGRAARLDRHGPLAVVAALRSRHRHRGVAGPARPGPAGDRTPDHRRGRGQHPCPARLRIPHRRLDRHRGRCHRRHRGHRDDAVPQRLLERVWAARDLTALRRGAVLGSLTRFPIVVAAGCVGIVATVLGLDPGSPPAPFFALVAGGPTWLLLAILVLTLTLIASTADTLQNGIAAAIAVRAPRLGVAGARVLTVIATLIPAAIAFQGFSVLRLFLIADLFCAATLVPVLLGLWSRTTRTGALTGAVAGLVSAAGYGLVVTGFDPASALAVTTFADGLTLGPFAAALLGSGLVTLVLSLLTRPCASPAQGDTRTTTPAAAGLLDR